MNIVITGHVDHGKSTLIGRLLFDTNSLPDSVIEEARRASEASGKGLEFAYLLDSFEEERAQNITIDTSQTFFKTDKRRYVIIDAPGHREFLKNMVSGASLAHAAILIVDAGRGMEEQTKRHALILKLLGLSQVVVVVNKMDSVAFSQQTFDKTRADVTSFFAELDSKPIAFVPISAREGDNIVQPSPKMPWYQSGSLLEILDSLTEPVELDKNPARFVVQDRYEMDGESVLVGRVESGTLSKGDKLTFLPSGMEASVNSIKVLEGQIEKAQSGKCVGVILDKTSNISRGEVACVGKPTATTKELKSVLFCLSPMGLERSTTYTLKCATQECDAKVSAIRSRINSSSLESLGTDATMLEDTEVGEVTISASKPVVIEHFNMVPGLGRFVLERDGEICAAGIVR